MRKQTTALVILAAAVLLGCAAAPAAAAWQIETVPCSVTPGPATMKLDSGGFPHIALKEYAGKEGFKNLLYVHKDSSGWHEENAAALDGSDEGSPIIEIDTSDYPHIFYARMVPDEPPVYYYYAYTIARKDASGWHYSSVAPTLWFWSPWQSYAFALDSNDVEHSFRDCPSLGTSRIYYDAESVITGSWLWGTANQLVSDLAMDSGGNPHICYRGTLQSPLAYLYRDGSGWHTETIDSNGSTANYISLALDSYDRPHVSYYGGPDGGLKYAYRDAGGWHVETVDGSGDVGMYNAIAVDVLDIPQIAYYDAANQELKYARRGESGWHSETVDSAGAHGGTADALTSLDIDSLNRPHIFYFDGDNYIYKYAVGPSACREEGECAAGYACVNGVCEPVPDDPPALGDGPHIAAGWWPLLSSSQASPTYLRQNTSLLWTFSDDFASCSGECTHTAQYQKVGDSEWTALSVSSDAENGYAWVELPLTGLQNATTYAFRFAVEDCASQTTQSQTYYFRVATSDAPPAITAGPFVAAGAWPRLARSAQSAFVMSQGSSVLWTFSDDYASCGGPVTHRAWYRLAGEESWTPLAVGTDPEGTWYAYVTLPVLNAGTYELLFDVADCAGQYRTPGYYYFKVE